MKTTFNTNMFDSIKVALEDAKTQGGNTNFKNILKLEAPATYVVRLLPNVKDPKKTFSHYFHHGWNAAATGKYFDIVSPSTWGERCPVSELYFKILRDGSEAEQTRAKANLRRKESWMVNVLVINDPKKPENNGTVKVLRYGRQLDKIINAAINGDDAAEFGSKIFDLSENGCNLRIKAELVTDKPGAPKYPTYTASKFLSQSAIEGMTEEKAAEVYNSIFDLDTFLEHKTPEEIKALIDANYYGKEGTAEVHTSANNSSAGGTPSVEVDEDVPYETKDFTTTPGTTESPVATKAAPSVVKAVSNDKKVQDILDDLDNLGKA